MSDAPMLAVARKGDRISHNAKFDDKNGAAALAVALGASVSSGGQGATCAAVGAGASTGAGAGGGGAKLDIKLRDVSPRSTTGQIEDGSPDTMMRNLPAALVAAQKVDCHHHRDKPIRYGSVNVFVNKKRLARASEQTCCGAVICDGDMTIRVGGATDDSAPADPLALLERGAAAASVAVGHAIAMVKDTITTVIAYGKELVRTAEADVKAIKDEVESTEAAIAADVGQVAGEVKSAALGVLWEIQRR